jgi:acetyl-CoA carboxylase biotin carboxyl carrier protein
MVEVGSAVVPGDSLCLLEVMKLFQTIAATVDGTIEAILVEDGALVEYEQPLMAVSAR